MTLSVTSVSTFVPCRFTSVLVDVLVWFSERDLRSSSLIFALFLSTLRWWNLFNAPSILRSASFLILLMSVLKSGSGLILARAEYLSDLGQVSLLKWSSISALKILFHVRLWGLLSELCAKNVTTSTNKVQSVVLYRQNPPVRFQCFKSYGRLYQHKYEHFRLSSLYQNRPIRADFVITTAYLGCKVQLHVLFVHPGQHPKVGHRQSGRSTGKA